MGTPRLRYLSPITSERIAHAPHRCFAGQGGRAERAAVLPRARRGLCSLAWSTAGGNSPAHSTLLAAAFAQPRYLAEEGSPTSQAGSLPKSMASKNRDCVPATLPLIYALPALVFSNNKRRGGKSSLRGEVKDQSAGTGRCLMTATVCPDPGLTHAASRINEPASTCSAPMRPGVLAPAHRQPRPQRSPAPAALFPAPWGRPLRPPGSQPSRLPLFPPKQP